MEITIKFSGREIDRDLVEFIEGRNGDAKRRLRERRLQFIDECRAADSLTHSDVEYLKGLVADD